MKKIIVVMTVLVLGACSSNDDDTENTGDNTLPSEMQADPNDMQADPNDMQADPNDMQADPGDMQADPGDMQADPGDMQTDTDEVQAGPGGLQTGATMGNVAETMAALEMSLTANDAISIVAQIDHQENAANAEEELRPTRVTLFGNPRLGTPLMNINQLAGLDLPQKMFAWTDENGQSHIAYNSAAYLSGRHGLSDAQSTLDTIDGALATLASNAGGQEFVPTEVSAPTMGEGIIVVPSENDFETTYNNLRGAIDSADPLNIMAELDHSENASKVELTLPPTRLIVFGNPKLGTPLMQSGQSIGIDLPQKMLVYENADGVVNLAYNDPAYLAQRHGITDQQSIIDTITQALNGLATNAAASP